MTSTQHRSRGKAASQVSVASVLLHPQVERGELSYARRAEGQHSGASSGLELYVGLVGSHRRKGLEPELRDAIRSGRLSQGTRLPSSRSLALDRGVARNTVMGAYDQLISEGWLEAGDCAGTWVAGRSLPSETAAAPTTTGNRRISYDLMPGALDVSAFPRATWLAAARRALSSAPAWALGDGDPRGLPQLRVALAAYLSRARGVAVTADPLKVCSGFAQALELLCEVLRSRGAEHLATEAHPADYR
jgi:GntR family transcriptional regulator/MocR family aminotransferase